MSEQSLSGKVAVVIGASRMRGLGRAIAVALSAKGADIVACASRSGATRLTSDEKQCGWRGLPSVVEEIQSAGRQAIGLNVDVTSTDDVQAMVREAVARFGRIDILVNNATVSRGEDRVPVTQLPESTWRSIIDVNLTGTWLASKFVAQQLIEQGEGGSIVSISSIAALKGQATFSAYAASKAGIHALNGVLAAELGPHGITCNVIAPGFLDTARIDVLRERDKWEKRLAPIPMGRVGKVEEVAEAACYLCGPHARWITGDVFVIDGGEVRRTSR